tara:strand:- start:524 stop:691 length:168 start_codon:yes stop_codon:yes gene_type:complete
MIELLITFIVVAIAFLGLAIGVLVSNKPLKGSCGGLSNIDGTCQICGRNNDSNCS